MITEAIDLDSFHHFAKVGLDNYEALRLTG